MWASGTTSTIWTGWASRGPEAAAQTQTGASLGQDAFMQLLVSQLRHQDPLNPLEGRDMLAQLAQFASLERLDRVAAELSVIGLDGVRLQALSLLGREVTLSDGRSGYVESVSLEQGGLVLGLADGSQVDLGDVIKVSNRGSAS